MVTRNVDLSVTLVIILFLRKHPLYVLLQELKRRDSTCDTKNIIYLAYCKKCNKQGAGSGIKWKPRLRNYKSHIKNKSPTCRIVKHFIDDCNDPHVPFKYFGFLLIDVLNNVDDLSENDIESLLLQKQKF